MDVCTGSGCVAIAFAKERPTWHVTGSDISADALDVARRNALKLGAVWNIDFRQSDLLASIGAEPRYDSITANAPYVPDAEVPTLAADIRNYEPAAALCGGPDGLAILLTPGQGGSRLAHAGRHARARGRGWAGGARGQGARRLRLLRRAAGAGLRRHRARGQRALAGVTGVRP